MSLTKISFFIVTAAAYGLTFLGFTGIDSQFHCYNRPSLGAFFSVVGYLMPAIFLHFIVGLLGSKYAYDANGALSDGEKIKRAYLAPILLWAFGFFSIKVGLGFPDDLLPVTQWAIQKDRCNPVLRFLAALVFFVPPTFLFFIFLHFLVFSTQHPKGNQTPIKKG